MKKISKTGSPASAIRPFAYINLRIIIKLKGKVLALVFASALLGGTCAAQSAVTEDFKPSTLNQPGQEYPQVNSQGYARFKIMYNFAQLLFK